MEFDTIKSGKEFDSGLLCTHFEVMVMEMITFIIDQSIRIS